MQVSSLFAVFALFCVFSGCVCRFVVTSSNASYICKHAPDSDSGCVRLSDVYSEIESRAKSSRANASNIIKIYVWVMVPFEDGYIFSKNHVQAAVYRALNDSGAELCGNGIEHKNDTCFEVSFNDTRCDADYVIKKVVDIRDEFILRSDQCTGNIEQNSSEKIPIFLGMTCDLTAGRVGALSNHWNWTDIFPGTRTVTFDDITTSSDMAMVRPGHTASDVGRFVTKLYQKYNWTKTDVVYTSKDNHGAPVHDDVISDCSTLMSGITMQFRNTLKWKSNDQYTIRSYSDDNALMAGAKKLLNQLRDNGRSSVWCVGRKVMRYIMNIAEEMDMANGDFSFLYLDLYNTNTSYSWSDVDDQNFYAEVNVTMGDSTEPLRALQVISLYQPETSEYKDFSDEMKTEIRKLSGGSISENGEFVNPFVPEYYNAIRLLVKGLERSSADGDFRDDRDFARKMWNTSFDSVDGVVTISEKGDRLMDYVLMDLNTETKKFEVASIYLGRNGSLKDVTEIDWPGTDVPHITKQLSNSNTNAIEIMISVAVVIIFFFLLTVLYVLRKVQLGRQYTLSIAGPL